MTNFVDTDLHHGWRKFWNSMPLDAPRRTNSDIIDLHQFSCALRPHSTVILSKCYHIRQHHIKYQKQKTFNNKNKKCYLWCKQCQRHACRCAIQLRSLGADENALFHFQEVGVLFPSYYRELFAWHWVPAAGVWPHVLHWSVNLHSTQFLPC